MIEVVSMILGGCYPPIVVKRLDAGFEIWDLAREFVWRTRVLRIENDGQERG